MTTLLIAQIVRSLIATGYESKQVQEHPILKEKHEAFVRRILGVAGLRLDDRDFAATPLNEQALAQLSAATNSASARNASQLDELASTTAGTTTSRRTPSLAGFTQQAVSTAGSSALRALSLLAGSGNGNVHRYIKLVPAEGTSPVDVVAVRTEAQLISALLEAASVHQAEIKQAETQNIAERRAESAQSFGGFLYEGLRLAQKSTVGDTWSVYQSALTKVVGDGAQRNSVVAGLMALYQARSLTNIALTEAQGADELAALLIEYKVFNEVRAQTDQGLPSQKLAIIEAMVAEMREVTTFLEQARQKISSVATVGGSALASHQEFSNIAALLEVAGNDRAAFNRAIARAIRAIVRAASADNALVGGASKRLAVLLQQVLTNIEATANAPVLASQGVTLRRFNVRAAAEPVAKPSFVVRRMLGQLKARAAQYNDPNGGNGDVPALIDALAVDLEQKMAAGQDLVLTEEQCVGDVIAKLAKRATPPQTAGKTSASAAGQAAAARFFANLKAEVESMYVKYQAAGLTNMADNNEPMMLALAAITDYKLLLDFDEKYQAQTTSPAAGFGNVMSNAGSVVLRFGRNIVNAAAPGLTSRQADKQTIVNDLLRRLQVLDAVLAANAPLPLKKAFLGDLAVCFAKAARAENAKVSREAPSTMPGVTNGPGELGAILDAYIARFERDAIKSVQEASSSTEVVNRAVRVARR